MTTEILTDERYTLEVFEETTLIVKVADVVTVTGDAAGLIAAHESTYNHGNIATAYGHSQAAHAPADATAAGAAGDIHAGTTHAPADAEANVNADWNAVSGDARILNKPAIPSISGLLNETSHDLLDHTGLTGVLALGTTAGTALAGDTVIPAAYTLPVATASVLGGVKEGAGTSIDANGVISVTASGGHTIQEEGTPLTARANLNFVGAGVTVTDGGATPDSTIVTIPAWQPIGSYEPANANIQSHIGTVAGNPHGTTYSDVGAAAALGTDDNYVTDAEKAALHGVNDINSSSATAAQGSNADASRVDVDMYGFLNQTETTIAFNPSGGTTPTNGLFTLGSVGASWSYYAKGVKHTITGSKTVEVPDATATTITYYIYIDNNVTTGALTCTTSAWDLYLDGRVPVATVARNSAMTPAYLLGEERHTIKIHRRDHMKEHYAEGAAYSSGGDPTGLTALTDTLAAITPAVSPCYWFDEDIYEVSDAIVDNQGLVTTPYSIAYKTGLNSWGWQRSLVPFKYTGVGFIEITNNTAGVVGGLAAWTTGAHSGTGSNSYVNYFMLVCSIQGQESVFFIPGQVLHANTTAAYAETFGSINLAGFPSKDGVAVYMFTYRCNGSQLGKVTLTRLPVKVSGNIITSSTVVSALHDGLTGVNLAGTGVTYGHIDDQAQTIAGAKTFTTSIALQETAGTSDKIILQAPADIAASYTLTLPTTDGNNNQLLKTDGSGVLSWTDPSAGGGLTISTKTYGFTAASGNIYQCDTSGGTIAVTLPTGVANAYFEIWDFDGTFATNAVTCTPASGEKINGQTANETLVLNVNNARVAFAYADATRGWQITITTNGITSGSRSMPFYKANGTLDTIGLLAGNYLPFFNTSGTSKNILLLA